jgi:hypothetical protein
MLMTKKGPLICRNLDSFQLCLSRAIPSPLSIKINHSAWPSELFDILAPFWPFIKDCDFSSGYFHKPLCQALLPLELTTLRKLKFSDPFGGFEKVLTQIMDGIHSSVKGSLSFDLYLSSEGSFSALRHPALLKSNQLYLESGITTS